MTLLLKNTRFIDFQTLDITEGDLIVSEDNKMPLLFNPTPEEIKAHNPLDILECNGMYVTKSFAVGHHHVYSALATGMPAPPVNPANFHEILKYVWWRLDRSLTMEMIEISALVTAMACAQNGSTFIIDHHASPFAIDGSLETIAKAFEKVGVSSLLCYEITDRDGEERADMGLEETESFLRSRPGLVGLHASFTVGNETLAKAVETMNKTRSGIHIHVAEDLYDQEHSLNHYNKRVVTRLKDSGALDSPKTILAHCLHLDSREKEIIYNSPVWVVQNSESNLNNNVGFFKGKGLGDRIMLGTDGMHSDMLRSAKASFFVGQAHDDINYAGAYSRFRNVHRYIAENRFQGDGPNNLVVLDYDPPTLLSADNFFGHFLFGFSSSNIQHVISDGRLIVKDRKVTTVDSEAILEQARKQAAALWKKMQSI